MLVTCEARALIRVDGFVLMQVRNNELQRSGTRLLSFPGGGVRATRHHEIANELREMGIRLSGERDLRFSIDPAYIESFCCWYYRGHGIETQAIHRELREELVQSSGLLSYHELQASHFTGHCPLRFEGGSLFHATWGQPTLYLVDSVEVTLPKAAGTRLLSQSYDDNSMIEFVAVEEILRGATQRSVIPALYSHFFG